MDTALNTFDPESPGEGGKVKKPPRKPRPSEIAAKKAKIKRKSVKKAVKTKAKREPAKPAPDVTRLDIRLTKAQKAKLTAKAKTKRRTITSVVIEAIERIK